MKNLFFLILVGLLNSGLAIAQSEIGSAEISFLFVSKDVEGTISGFDSKSSINLDDLSKSKLKGSVAVETIKTGNFLRDWSLKKGKYFDEESHPTIGFESTEILEKDDKILVKGNLRIKETTKNISIEFTRNDCQFIGTTSLFTSDYNINIKSKREDNLVRVKFVLNLDE